MPQPSDQHREIKQKLMDLYAELFLHEGYGSLRVQMRFLKRGQKEILLICGKEYRYVVDYPLEAAAAKGPVNLDEEEPAADVAECRGRKSQK